MRLLAIDPGSTESAYCLIDTDTLNPLEFDKTNNHQLLHWIDNHAFQLREMTAVIEWIRSYGMTVGREVFDTCRWVGRFQQALLLAGSVELVERMEVKLHHCGTSKANDGNIRQALVDRFTPGASNHGKGAKNQPGWFYGFHSDIWQAYALAVYAADKAQP